MTKIIQWQELTGDKLRTKLHPDMLSTDGYLKSASIPINRRLKQSEQGYVIFDKDYVLAVLKSQLTALQIDIDTAIDLIIDCFTGLEGIEDAYNLGEVNEL
jgi:hypothetical protein